MKVYYSGGRDSHPETAIAAQRPCVMLSFYDLKIAERTRTRRRLHRMVKNRK